VAVLPRSFYARDAETVGRALLGCILARRVEGVLRRARLTETEAYVGAHDLASHSSKGRTRRNDAMFGPPGRAYVYLIYGMHHCLNVVTGEDGDGQAVLLRGAEPLDGWEVDLRGPGRLARAFGVTRSDDRLDLVRGPLRLHAAPGPVSVDATARIGVDYAGEWTHAPLRFTDGGSVHVSRRPASGGRHRKGLARIGDGPAMAKPAKAANATKAAKPKPRTPLLKPAERKQLAARVPKWKVTGKRLARDLAMKDFDEAIALVRAVADLARRADHHPDIHLTDYRKVRIETWSHDAGGLTVRDFSLAEEIDAFAEARPEDK
jgi:DNA-3-methyladenine glycosylase